mgnify:FL=1|jgi:type IV secretory pathway component VirB8
MLKLPSFLRPAAAAAGGDDRQKTDSPYQESLSFTAFRIDLIKASEKKAWKAAWILGSVACLEAAAIALMMPLKTTEPFVITLDRAAGLASVLQIADAKSIPVSEAQDKYWLSQYVLARESYDYRTLENDFLKTRELSTPTVFSPYAAQFGDRDGSLEKKWGDSKRVVITITSVVPTGNGIATVRFTRKLVNTSSGLPESESRWMATIGYEYHPEFRVKEERLIVNPFGFKVTTYRLDEEINGAPSKPAADSQSSEESHA